MHPRAPLPSDPVRRRAVFVSYASEDTAAVAKLAAALADAGVDVWFDRSELHGGDAWDAKIRRQVRECSLFLPVISANAARRHEGYFRLEWALADERTRMIAPNRPFLVPVSIDGTLDADAPESFHRAQWTQLPGGEPTPEFCRRIVALLDGTVPPATGGLAAAGGARAAPRRTRIRLAAAAAVLLAIAGAVGLQQWRATTERVAETAGPKSLAVLSFRDLSPARDLGYLADGLAEELGARLGREPGIQLTALGSTRRFADSTQDSRSIGRALGVESLLEGSVRVEGSRLLVTASLVDAASGRTRWSESYSRPFDQIFTVQQEIAQAILNRVLDDYDAARAGAPPSAATSTDAYVMYLKGREQFRLRTPQSIREARKLFEQALALDPEYAPAYVGVADAVRLLARGSGSYGDLDPTIAAQVSKENVDKALLRDPGLPQAYGALGQIERIAGRNDEALSAFDKAIQLSPSYADAHMWRYLLLRELGRPVDALASLETARRLDPLSPVIQRNYAIELADRGRVAEAREVLQKVVALDAESPVGWRALAQIAYSTGDLVRSAELYRKVLERSPDTDQYRVALGEIFMIVGLPQAAARLLERDAYRVNLAIAAGDFERALEISRRAHAANPDDPLLAFERAWYETLWGDREQGRTVLRSIDATIGGAGWYDRNYCSPNVEMSYAYPAGADRERWLKRCRTYAQQQAANGFVSSELSYLQARIAALDGRTAEAANALADAVRRGWRQPWTARDPLLAAVVATPAGAEAVRTMAASIGAQRAPLERHAREWGYTP